jgi:transposase
VGGPVEGNEDRAGLEVANARLARLTVGRLARRPPVPAREQGRRVEDDHGDKGRELLADLALPEPWTATLTTSLAMIDELDARIDACEAELRALGAEHPSIPLLLTVPGVGWVLAYTIASEIGDIA